MNWTTEQLGDYYLRMGSEAPVTDVCGDGKRRHKYGVAPKEDRTVDGIVFDSKREAYWYVTLRQWESSGAIEDLVLQPSFELQAAFVDSAGTRHREIKYVADFSYSTVGEWATAFGGQKQSMFVIDVKGYKTPEFRIKEKLFRKKFPELRLEIWK